jgi:hypothetical protein
MRDFVEKKEYIPSLIQCTRAHGNLSISATVFHQTAENVPPIFLFVAACCWTLLGYGFYFSSINNFSNNRSGDEEYEVILIEFNKII